MILPIDDTAPLWVRAGADTILLAHIGAGMVGLTAGAAVLVLRKGTALHRRVGTVFFVSMLLMSCIGACVAPFLHSRLSTVMGAFTFYLVLTGWLAMRRKPNTTGTMEIVALAIAIACTLADFLLGLEGMSSPTGEIDGLPYQPAFIFGTVALIAVLTDLRTILRGGLSGAARVARHLWRMCFALVIAESSLFQGQPQVFPEELRGSLVLFAPVVITLGLMIFWLVWGYAKSRPRNGRFLRSLPAQDR